MQTKKHMTKRKFKVGDNILVGGLEYDNKYVLCEVVELLPNNEYKVKEVFSPKQCFIAKQIDMYHEGADQYYRD